MQLGQRVRVEQNGVRPPQQVVDRRQGQLLVNRVAQGDRFLERQALRGALLNVGDDAAGVATETVGEVRRVFLRQPSVHGDAGVEVHRVVNVRWVKVATGNLQLLRVDFLAIHVVVALQRLPNQGKSARRHLPVVGNLPTGQGNHAVSFGIERGAPGYLRRAQRLFSVGRLQFADCVLNVVTGGLLVLVVVDGLNQLVETFLGYFASVGTTTVVVGTTIRGNQWAQADPAGLDILERHLGVRVAVVDGR